MTQAELNREVASVTGESMKTIQDIGFVPLMHIPYERDRDPLVVDWDDLDSERQFVHPISIN